MTVPLITFTRDGVQPPSRFYLRPFERIEIRLVSAVIYRIKLLN
jgi:hypothetical protein